MHVEFFSLKSLYTEVKRYLKNARIRYYELAWLSAADFPKSSREARLFLVLETRASRDAYHTQFVANVCKLVQPCIFRDATDSKKRSEELCPVTSLLSAEKKEIYYNYQRVINFQ